MTGQIVEGLRQLGTALGAVGMAIGLPTLLMYAIKERRKNNAANEVAERTIDAEVSVKDTAADDARLLHAIAAFDAERASLQRQLDDRDHEIRRQRAELDYKDELLASRDATVTRLRGQVEDLLQRLAEATRELHTVRIELAELAEGHEWDPTAPPAP